MKDKIKMKATGKIGYLTGITKKRAGNLYYQILFPWTEKDNKYFEKYHGKKRPLDDKGLKEYHKEVMFIKEEKMDILEKIKLYEAKKPTILGPVKKKINNKLKKEVSGTYFKSIPLDDIFNVLKEFGISPLQEDQTEWDGFLVGGVKKTEQVYFDLGYINSKDDNGRYEVITNAKLALSYYKMESGKYEVLFYVA